MKCDGWIITESRSNGGKALHNENSHCNLNNTEK